MFFKSKVEAIDWNAVVEDLGPDLYRYFRSRSDEVEANDLVQETLVRLVKKVDDDEFNIAKGSLRMFAFGIAHFVRLEHGRGATKQEVSSRDDRFITKGFDENQRLPDEKVHGQQMVGVLRKAILKLPQPQQDIVSLLVDRSLTNKEISLILNIPVGTIKSHIHRAKENLKYEIEKNVGDVYV